MRVRRFVIPMTVVLVAASFVVAPAVQAAPPKCFGKKPTKVGTSGADELVGTAKADVIVGLGGNDILIGRGGNDLICGNGGNDELLGVGGADKLNGGGGYELLQGGKGNDLLKGGAGGAAARYDHAAAPVVVDLAAGRATGEGTDNLVAIVDAAGTEFDDVLRGNGIDNLLLGQGGNDRLFGNDGNDYLLGRGGDDNVDGGAGVQDVASFALAEEPVNVNLPMGSATGEGNDTLVGIEGAEGGSAADVFVGDEISNGFFGGDGADDLSGAAGDDFLDGEGGTDTADGGPGTDLCRAENVQNCEGARGRLPGAESTFARYPDRTANELGEIVERVDGVPVDPYLEVQVVTGA